MIKVLKEIPNSEKELEERRVVATDHFVTAVKQDSLYADKIIKEIPPSDQGFLFVIVVDSPILFHKFCSVHTRTIYLFFCLSSRNQPSRI